VTVFSHPLSAGCPRATETKAIKSVKTSTEAMSLHFMVYFLSFNGCFIKLSF
jgi:hypothetical protein